MSTTGIAIDPAKPRLGSAFAGVLVGAVVVVGLAIAGAAGSTDEAVVVAVVAGGVGRRRRCSSAVQRPSEPLWAWTLAVASGRRRSRSSAPAAAPLVPFVAFAFAVALPEGRLPTRAPRGSSRLGAVSRSAAAVVAGDDRQRARARWSASRSCSGSARSFAYVRACRRAGAVEPQPVAVGRLGRRRRPAGSPWRSACSRRCSTGRASRPSSPSAPRCSCRSRSRSRRSRRSRCASTACSCTRSRRGGIVIMVGAVYLVVVLGFGDAPDQSERRVLGLSIVAAVLAALLYGPVEEPALGRRPTAASTASAKRPTSRCRRSARACPVRSRSTSCCCSSRSR